jgi:hypothetical protein
MSSQHPHASTFLDRYLNGELLAEDIDDFIDMWHNNPGTKELYEFLGMTAEEYSLWLRDPDTLPHIARARRAHLPLRRVIHTTVEEMSIAARSADKVKVERWRAWLSRSGKTD